MTGLKRLDLKTTRITDAGLLHLTGLTRLEHLDLAFSTTITDAGIASLKEALPALEIKR